MSWVRLDDGFFRNSKARAAGRDGRALYLAGLCYCAGSLTDGYVRADALPILCAEAEVKQAAARRLVEVGLWSEAPGSGWWVHDYNDYNPTAEQVRDQRAREREKKRRQRAAGSHAVDRDPNNGQYMSPGDSEGDNPGESTQGVPRYPSPTPSSTYISSQLTVVAANGKPGAELDQSAKHLADNLARICTGQQRARVEAEAQAVIAHCLAHVDRRLVDEAIGTYTQAETKPVLPRALVPVVAQRAADHGIRLPQWDT